MTSLRGATEEAIQASSLPRRALVWDRVVRTFHWFIVTACLTDIFILDNGRLWHRLLGYGVMAALLVRVIWGMVGSRHARFADFVPNPATLRSYLQHLARGTEPRFLGHNPAGAMMILILMGLLASVSITGWMLTLDAYFGDERLEEIHGVLADAILAMAGIHIAAAFYESVRHNENLILAMITGYKRS